MDKAEIIRRLEQISSHAVHTVGEEPFVMSLDDGIAVKEAIYLITQQLAKDINVPSKWISVEDKLPDKCTNYLVYFGKGIGTTMKTAVWLPEKRIWKGAEAYSTLNGITHWMLLPKPPEEVKQDG